jgi:plasmid replication initiation protein
MKKLISSLLRKILYKIDIEEYKYTQQPVDEILKEEDPVTLQVVQVEEIKPEQPEKLKVIKPKKPKGPKLPELTPQERAARDITEMMEVPFLALSKNRREPIIYEKHDGPNMMKVKVSRHTGHFLASIYDWDIVLYVAGKMQEILNKGSDIPPRTMVIPRHELLKALKRYDGRKQQKDLEASLSRLQLTGIETTIRNEDGRYRAGFGFLEDWSYTERKDVREIEVTLSRWLYDGICVKGALLMVDPDYFSITSALKRFLYRTARKHVGGHGNNWEFSVETLYEKSGSEREFRFFKRDLKEAVLQNDTPGYHLEWVEKNKKAFVSFRNIKKILLSIGLKGKSQEEDFLQN